MKLHHNIKIIDEYEHDEKTYKIVCFDFTDFRYLMDCEIIIYIDRMLHEFRCVDFFIRGGRSRGCDIYLCKEDIFQISLLSGWKRIYDQIKKYDNEYE